MKIANSWILVAILAFQSCSQYRDHFTIYGKTTGFRDSTVIYLNDPKIGSFYDNIDSAYVINNSFTFNGSVSEPKQLLIHTGIKGDQNQMHENFHYVLFFVDNSNIYLNDDRGDLCYSTFRGSKLQNDNTDLILTVKKFLIKGDSIMEVIKNLPSSDIIKLNALHKESRENWDCMYEAMSGFIESHPKSILSIISLNAHKTSYGKVKTKRLFNRLDPKIQNTSEGKTILEYCEYVKPEYVKNFGDLNDIELPDLDGKLIKLSSLKGKYILLEFWASWCGACRLEHPNLLKLYKMYNAMGFEIYGISLDKNKESWQNAVRADKIPWITVSDLKGDDSKEAEIYGVTGIPKNYLVDREGVIIAQNIRGEELAKKLAEIFKNQ